MANAFLAKQQAALERERVAASLFAAQHTKDMMMIAANRAFGFGPKRNKLLGDTLDEVMTEFANLTLEDVTADKAIVYTKAKVDESLRRVCGKFFKPWEERF